MNGLVNNGNGGVKAVLHKAEKLIIDTDPGIGLFHLFVFQFSILNCLICLIFCLFH